MLKIDLVHYYMMHHMVHYWTQRVDIYANCAAKIVLIDALLILKHKCVHI